MEIHHKGGVGWCGRNHPEDLTVPSVEHPSLQLMNQIEDMNFSCLFVIICLGALVSPPKIYLCFAKNRFRAEKTPEEIAKQLNGNTGFPLINGLVQMASHARSWTQWTRRLLKALRKWCSSHPPEVKLGKCLASYFNIKIPELRRYEKIIENTTKTEYPREMSKKLKIKPEAFVESPSQTRVVKATSFKKIFISPLRNFLSEITSRLKQFCDFIFRNAFVTCVWDYFWKKFWTWVDSAPDYHTYV